MIHLDLKRYFSMHCFVMVFLLVLPAISFAITSECQKKLHKQAAVDASKLLPESLKKSFSSNERIIGSEVDKIHAIANSSRKSFENEYKEAQKLLYNFSDTDNSALRGLLSLSYFLYMKYSPIKTYESCNEDKILTDVTVTYDGFDILPRYSKTLSDYFLDEPYAYDKKTLRDAKMLQFYNMLVNEIADLWTELWQGSGHEITGLAVTNTFVRRPQKNQAVLSGPVEKDSGSTQNYSDGSLKKYKEESDAHKRMRDEYRSVDQKEGIERDKNLLRDGLKRRDATGEAVKDINEERLQ